MDGRPRESRRNSLIAGVAALIVGAAAMPAWAEGGDVPTTPAPAPTRAALRQAMQDPATLWQELREGGLVLADLPHPEPEITNMGFGPLFLRSQSPFQSLRLGISADTPVSLRRGQWESRDSLDWSRMWAESDNYLLDFDTWNSAHRIFYGVTDRLQLEVGVVESGWSKGRIDRFVRDFHDTFGIDQRGRDARPLGEFAFRLRPNPRASTVDLGRLDRTSVSEYLTFSLHQVVLDGSDVLPTIAGSVTFKTDLNDSSEVKGGPVDVAVSVSLAKNVGDFYAYVVVGVAWNGYETYHGLQLRPLTASGIAALEWRFVEDVSLVVEAHWTQGAVRTFGSFSEPTTEIFAGAKFRVCAAAVFEVGLAENILVFDNSPDFGLHSGLSVRF